MKSPKEIDSDSSTENDLILSIMNGINDCYWNPLRNYIENTSELIRTFPAFLLQHDHIALYIGRNHIAIEYFGPETIYRLSDPKTVKVFYRDFSESELNFFEEIVGFKFESTAMEFTLPLPQYSEDLVYPTNKGAEKLIELNWNWSAQNSIMGFNAPSFHVQDGMFTRMVNARFFDANESGLKTRHIKWIDFLPIKVNNETEDIRDVEVPLGELASLVQHDAHFRYPLPPIDDFKFNKLPQLNRFIELVGDLKTTEPILTKFLELPENRFILTMGFLSKEVHPQLLLKWQSQERDDIKPDFFIVRPNGFADIVEFKLPVLNSKVVVGRTNREAFSAEINSYIAQTRVYREYFEDPNNRKWVKSNYDINVRYPKRFLVIGRRLDFTNEVWKGILDEYKEVEIMTFDELVDGVASQFYM